MQMYSSLNPGTDAQTIRPLLFWTHPAIWGWNTPFFYNHFFVPLLRETCHFQLAACCDARHPQAHLLCDSAGSGCACLPVCVRAHEGPVQQGFNTHVLLREPSATCRPVWHSPCHPHVICGHEPLRLLQALLNLTYSLIAHLIVNTISQKHSDGPIYAI